VSRFHFEDLVELADDAAESKRCYADALSTLLLLRGELELLRTKSPRLAALVAQHARGILGRGVFA
jgi:hypothetical protein